MIMWQFVLFGSGVWRAGICIAKWAAGLNGALCSCGYKFMCAARLIL